MTTRLALGSTSARAGVIAAASLMALSACGAGADSAGRGKDATEVPAPSTPQGCPSPPQAVSIGTPGPWLVIGRTGPEGPYRDKEVSESKVTVTNPNGVPVRAKVIVLLGSPALSRSGTLVEYGVPSVSGLRSDGGLDYSVTAAVTVPAEASVEVAARMLTIPSPSVKALYGVADILAPSTDRPCNISVAGADPIKLLGGNEAAGCTDPAAGC